MSLSNSQKEVRDLRILPGQKRQHAYTMRGKCLNCGWEGKILIPKGDKAPGSRHLFDQGTYCDTCGCSTLVAVR